MFSTRTIFISPLDWGLGHATRLVPLITALKKDNKVILGVSPSNVLFFGDLFPDLRKIELPSYQISYSRFLPVWLKIIFQAPRIFAVIRKEKRLLEKIISEHSVNLVISDNRYGLYDKVVESIFITHQLTVLSPVFSSLANRIHLKLIHHFKEVWVPDYEPLSERLSGLLSENPNVKIPLRFLGPQSRFSEKKLRENKTFDILILLSGTEPQRQILENILLEKFEKSKLKIVLVRGKRGNSLSHKNIQVIDFSEIDQLAELIVNAKTVICRSAYSTLMDLHVLGHNDLILIPTPGQTEQEYLATYWEKKFGARVVRQNAIKTAELGLERSF